MEQQPTTPRNRERRRRLGWMTPRRAAAAFALTTVVTAGCGTHEAQGVSAETSPHQKSPRATPAAQRLIQLSWNDRVVCEAINQKLGDGVVEHPRGVVDGQRVLQCAKPSDGLLAPSWDADSFEGGMQRSLSFNEETGKWTEVDTSCVGDKDNSSKMVIKVKGKVLKMPGVSPYTPNDPHCDDGKITMNEGILRMDFVRQMQRKPLFTTRPTQPN